MTREIKNDLEVCFEAVDDFVERLDAVGRDLEESEISGLTEITEEYGTAKVLEVLVKINESVNQKTVDVFTMKRRNEFIFGHLGIDEWIQMEIEADKKLASPARG